MLRWCGDREPGTGCPLRVRPPGRGRDVVGNFGPGDGEDVEFGAIAGARLTFKATSDRRTGVDARITTLTAPDGTVSFRPDLQDNIKARRGTETLVRELDQSGTWRVRIVGSGGTPGDLRFSYRLRQPRRATYSAD